MFKLIPIFLLVAVCYGKGIDVHNFLNLIQEKYQTDVETSATNQLNDDQLSFTSSRNADLCRFFLYRRATPNMPETVLAERTSVDAASFSDLITTVILIHGHGGSAFTSLNPIVKDAILSVEDVNLVVVDWSIYASLSYSAAVGTVDDIAASVANFINVLIDPIAPVTTLGQIHLVGFNLGAHVAGIAGRSIRGIARITGLDPSGSQWESNSNRLRRTDANYVEVIHTDGSGISNNGIGISLGHIDFYANGGSSQPGCFTNTCSHERAYELFAASMSNEDLIGYQCSSNLQLSLNLCKGLGVRMGTNHLVKFGGGMYRVNTKRNFPF